MNRKRPLVAHGPRDWMPCKHRGSGSSSPVSSLRLSRFCDSSIQELWSLPPLCRGTAQTWRGWMMSGHQEVGGPGRHPFLLPGGAVLGRVPLAGPLDIFLSTHHLARAWDSMSHSALCCFFLGQSKLHIRLSGEGLRLWKMRRLHIISISGLTFCKAPCRTWLGYKLLCDLTAHELPPRGGRRLPHCDKGTSQCEVSGYRCSPDVECDSNFIQ